MSKYSRACGIAIVGVCLIMSAGPGWSAAVCAVPIQAGAGEQIERLYPEEQNRWLVETRNAVFHLNESGKLEPFEGPVLRSLSHVVPLNRDLSLIFAQGRNAAPGGVFRADKANLKAQELNGSEALRFITVGRLAMGGAIVGTDRGLFRVDATGSQFQEVSAETGRVSVLEQVDDSTWLIGAAAGIFRSDGRASRADRLLGADTGEVTQVQRLADGGWLVAAEKGVFRADPAGRNLTALPWRKPIRVAEIQKLADGSWIVRADQGLFIADPQGRRLDLVEEDALSAWRIHVNDERGLLLQNKRLLYVLLPGAKKLEFVSGEPVSDVSQARAVQDGWLIGTRRGLFRVDLQRRRLLSFRGPALGRVVSLHPLKNGAWIAATDNGLFRTDQALQSAELVPGANVGQVLVMRPLNNGSLLIGTARGLFRMDPEAQGTAQLSPAGQTEVAALEQLTTGSWLAAGRGGLVTLDANGDAVMPVPGAPTDDRNILIQPLQDGRALISSSRGMLSIGTSLADANVTLTADGWLGGFWGENTTVKAALRHPCAAATDTMNLVVEARQEAAAGNATPVRAAAHVTGRAADTANLSAEFSDLQAGRWNMRLLASAGKSEVAIGKSASILIERTSSQWLQANWPWMLVALGVVQTVAFGSVLGLALWRPRLLRLVRSRWGAMLVWLSPLVPRSWLLQRWVLSPWFREERKRVSSTSSVIDVVARGPDDAELKAKDLVARLAIVNRVWLQGPSGLGKSTTFAAWQSAFFGESSSLSKAARRFGFALLPIPVHLIPPVGPDNNPDKLIFETADAALHGGRAERDPPLVRAMVRQGRLALAFDSPDEAMRKAIRAFARKHPKSRFIVTSDRPAPAGFDAWQLPRDVPTEMVERLLQLWLGAYSGSRLTAQLEREDVLAHLVTYYDVRIVADLVTDDPKQVVPTDRIGLYRALFARAGAKEPNLQDLGPLKSLAWAMTVAGRSEMKAEELAWLDRSSRDALLAPGSRVLRELPGGYAFDHDQIRFLLAAENLVEGNKTMFSLFSALENSPVWNCDRGDQEALWRFVAAALAPEDLPQVWRFTLEDPARAFLQCALRKQGFETKIFPLGMASVLAGREEHAPPVRLRAVEA